VLFDLGQEAALDSIRWSFKRTGFADRFTIDVSRDRTTWTTLATRRNSAAGVTKTLTTNAVGRYVRFRFTNPNRDAQVGFLAEVALYGRLTGAASVSATDEDSGLSATDVATPTPTTEAPAAIVTPPVAPTPTTEAPTAVEPDVTPVPADAEPPPEIGTVEPTPTPETDRPTRDRRPRQPTG